MDNADLHLSCGRDRLLTRTDSWYYNLMNSKIDARERQLRNEAVQYGFASVRMEGLEPGPEAEAIAHRFIEGELSHDEYHAAMRRLALSIARER